MVYEPTMSPRGLMLIARVVLAFGKSMGGSLRLGGAAVGAASIGFSSPTPMNGIIWSNMAGSSISASARPDRTRLAMTRHDHAVRRFMLILFRLCKVHLQIIRR